MLIETEVAIRGLFYIRVSEVDVVSMECIDLHPTTCWFFLLFSGITLLYIRHLYMLRHLLLIPIRHLCIQVIIRVILP